MAGSLTLILYDVASDRQRTRLARTLEAFSVRVQKSAFEGRLTPAERREILRRAAGLIDPATDRLSLYVLGKAAEERVTSIGLPRPDVDASEWWIV